MIDSNNSNCVYEIWSKESEIQPQMNSQKQVILLPSVILLLSCNDSSLPLALTLTVSNNYSLLQQSLNKTYTYNRSLCTF